MNWEQVQGQWKQYSGKALEKWGKLTDRDLDVIAGQREQLVGKIEERYGVVKEEAERQVNEFTAGMNAERETYDTQRKKSRSDGRV